MTGAELVAGSNLDGLTVVMTFTPKGGAGKTHLQDILEGCATLAGLRTLVADVDDGNNGLRKRIGENKVLKISWECSPAYAEEWVRSYVRDIDFLGFDLGANILSSGLPIANFLGQVLALLNDRGAAIHICVVASTNAPVANLLPRLQETYGRLGEITVVTNNQDGSEAFPDWTRGESMHTFSLPHIAAGVQAVRLRRQVPLAEFLRHPEDGFRLATALVAKAALQVASQPRVQALLRCNPEIPLIALAAAAPAFGLYAIDTLASAADAKLAANDALKRAYVALLETDLPEDDILKAAIAFRNQYAVYRRP
jgi:hypothetical protein